MSTEKSKAPLFKMWVVAIILGVALYKQFDFDNLRFKNTALSVIYMATFVFVVYVIIKNRKKKTEQ